jgi:branched-chain amino acid transport system substrate-binding protein
MCPSRAFLDYLDGCAKMLLSKKSSILVLSCLVFSLAGPLTFWLSNRQNQAARLQRSSAVAATTQVSLPKFPFVGLWNSKPTRSVKSRLSLGDKILVTADDNADKQAGIAAFKAGKFTEAQTLFSAALKGQRNDPETWIYLNNTIAALKGNSLRIAASVPVGGNLNIAKEILRGVAQAQDQINRSGGIRGRLLQVEIANDDNDTAIAKQIATELVKDSSILAVVGHNSSEASLIAAPIYQQAGLVMISPTSTASSLSGIGSHIFRTTPSTRVTADTLAHYVVNVAHHTKVAVCAASQDKASKSFKEEFAWSLAQYGGRLTNANCDFSAANFSPSDVPSQAISAGADALLIAPSLYTINQATEVIQANNGRLALFGNQTIYVIDTLKRGQAGVNGMVLAVPWFPQETSGSPFIKESKNLWGAPGNWRTAMAFDATQAAIQGLNAGQSREQLFKSLSSSDFSFRGATGVIEFLPSGDRSLRGTLVQVRPGQNSGTGYDFMPLSPPSDGGAKVIHEPPYE